MSWLEIISLIGEAAVGLAALLVSTILAIVVYFGSRRIADVEYWRAVRDAWIQIDSFVLADNEILQQADSLWHPELAHQATEERRKRWLTYMALNTYVSSYFGPSRPIPSLEESQRYVLTQLEPMIKDDVFYHVTQSGIYPPKFEEACRDLRRTQGLPTDQ
jgi:hypothetical protein